MLYERKRILIHLCNKKYNFFFKNLYKMIINERLQFLP